MKHYPSEETEFVAFLKKKAPFVVHIEPKFSKEKPNKDRPIKFVIIDSQFNIVFETNNLYNDSGNYSKEVNEAYKKFGVKKKDCDFATSLEDFVSTVFTDFSLSAVDRFLKKKKDATEDDLWPYYNLVEGVNYTRDPSSADYNRFKKEFELFDHHQMYLDQVRYAKRHKKNKTFTAEYATSSRRMLTQYKPGYIWVELGNKPFIYRHA